MGVAAFVKWTNHPKGSFALVFSYTTYLTIKVVLYTFLGVVVVCLSFMDLLFVAVLAKWLICFWLLV